jgi:hypothetical protein
LSILKLDRIVITVAAISCFHFSAQWNGEWMQFCAKERLLLNLYSKFVWLCSFKEYCTSAKIKKRNIFSISGKVK